MPKVEIVSSPSPENPFVVINKPASLPSAPLHDGDKDNAFAECAALFPELLQVEGRKKCEHGLLHRLDTATSGLLVIAATNEAYAALMKAQEEGLFLKTYTAICDKAAKMNEGFPPFPSEWADRLESSAECTVESYFRPFGAKGAAVRPVTRESGKAAQKKSGSKLYRTQIKISGDIATCEIAAGYRHQVRCHLSWAGYAVRGDSLYNPKYTGGELCFTASAIRFPHPLTSVPFFFQLY